MIRQLITIPATGSGQRLIPAIIAAAPQITSSQIYKALRKKDIRINGKRISADQPVEAGDQIEIFLPDASGSTRDKKAVTIGSEPTNQPPFSVVFSDFRLMILNKRAGIVVHGGGAGSDGEGTGLIAGQDEEETLIALVRSHFKDPKLTLCHRLDRNTGGLIVLARSSEIQREIEFLMKSGQITKRYRCLVRGEPLTGTPVRATDNGKFWELESFLEKRARQNEVYIHDVEQPGDVPVVTRYRILRRFPEFGPNSETVSELEVELVTGRTHQIRAHLAHFGHPVLGDGKYGRNSYNRHFKASRGSLSRQQLFACHLMFSPGIKKGPLADLAGRTFRVEPAYDLDLPIPAEQ